MLRQSLAKCSYLFAIFCFLCTSDFVGLFFFQGKGYRVDVTRASFSPAESFRKHSRILWRCDWFFANNKSHFFCYCLSLVSFYCVLINNLSMLNHTRSWGACCSFSDWESCDGNTTWWCLCQALLWVQWDVFWYFMHSKEPSDILTLVIPYLLGPEHGPSVDGLSTSPQPALGNECKQQKRAASVGNPNKYPFGQRMSAWEELWK